MSVLEYAMIVNETGNSIRGSRWELPYCIIRVAYPTQHGAGAGQGKRAAAEAHALTETEAFRVYEGIL